MDIAGTLSTVLPHMLRQRYCRKNMHAMTRNLLRLDDGGVIAIDWSHPSPTVQPGRSPGSSSDEPDAPAPVIVMMHGLCGSSESTYIRLMTEKATAQGFEVAVMNARGCGRVPLVTNVGMHAARTSDFRRAVKHVRAVRPNTQVFAVGFSLGAGVLAKYLGEHGDDALLDGAVCISPAWDFLKTYSTI